MKDWLADNEDGLIRISISSDGHIVDYDPSRGMYRVRIYLEGLLEYETWFDAYEETEVEDVVKCKNCAKRKTIQCPMCKEETDIDFHSRYTYIIDKTEDDGYCNFGVNKTSL